MANRRALDPAVWKACAGVPATTRLPVAGDLVYYFPQGHAEHASSPPDLSPLLPLRLPSSLCRVTAVSLLADPDTDEPFARILLDPRPSVPPPPPPPAPTECVGGGGVLSASKTLTQSDASLGGGFSMPRHIAETVLPRLDFAAAERPSQDLSIRDLNGREWEFHHVYRGKPLRHLFTTGWSKFVNGKKLVAGDTLVFVQDRNGELFLGIRRSRVSRSNEGVRGRVPPETVVEAVRLMELGRPFEVLHYPRAESAEFLVAAESVYSAMAVHWWQGRRVRLKVGAEESTAMWMAGTVSDMAVRNVPPWPPSPWQMLKVRWDDPDILENFRYVSPWQVELVSDTSYIRTPYPDTKKFGVLESPESLGDTDGSTLKKLRVSKHSGLLGDTYGNTVFPMTTFNATNMGNLTPSLFDFSTFPAGMQGARHDIHVSSLSNSVTTNAYDTSYDDLFSNRMPQIQFKKVSRELRIGSASQSPELEKVSKDLSIVSASQSQELEKVSTDLSIGSASQSQELEKVSKDLSSGSASQSQGSSLPLSQESIHDSGTELLSSAAYSSEEAIEGSFQLFGQTIHVKQPTGGLFESIDRAK